MEGETPVTVATGRRAAEELLRTSLLFCFLCAGSDAQCNGRFEYLCDGSPPFCCSYYAYVGSRLSGELIFGIVFGVVFLTSTVLLLVYTCMKHGRGARVGVFNSSYINTVTQGYPGPPPPYAYNYEMIPSPLQPPPYTPTQPRADSYSPLQPPPYTPTQPRADSYTPPPYPGGCAYK